MDTTNDTIIPVRRTASSLPEKWKPNFTSLRRLAPNIVGTARKNVNSAATGLAIPIRSAPTIVAPEREVPGKRAAISWNTPIMKAALYVSSSMVFTLGFLFLFQFSTTMKAIPNTIRATAIT